jgi:hypothetical protein
VPAETARFLLLTICTGDCRGLTQYIVKGGGYYDAGEMGVDYICEGAGKIFREELNNHPLPNARKRLILYRLPVVE